MNILFITEPNIIGGATRSLVELTRELTKMKHKCIVCQNSYNEVSKELEANGVKVIICHNQVAMVSKINPKILMLLKIIHCKIRLFIGDIVAIKAIEKHVNLNEIDIIHTNSARNDLGCVLQKKYNIPHVVHFREYGDKDFNCIFLKKNYINFLNNYTDRFIAVSDGVKENWIYKGIKQEKIVRIYNGVCSKDISCSTHNFGNIKIIFSGALSKAKGQEELIKAINILVNERQIKNIKACIVGHNDIKYKKYLLELIHEFTLEKYIEIQDARKDIYKYLSEFDVGVVCSKAEGFGRVTAEYMFAGLGIVATNTGANTELIEDNVNGFLYKRGDYIDFADKLQKYIEDKNLIKKHGEKAREIARNKYDITICADNVEKVYENMHKS